MLCAKNLKVALAAILGVVGLVGAGTAHAAINLNPPQSGAGTPPHEPQYFAAEKLYAAALAATVASPGRRPTPVVVMATSSGFNVEVPQIPAAFLTSDPTYFVRFDLLANNVNDSERVRFHQTNTNTSDKPALFRGASDESLTVTLVQYGPNSTSVIYSMSGLAANIAASEGTIKWNLVDNAIQARNGSPFEEVTYHLRVSIYTSRTDAIRGGDMTTGGAIFRKQNSILGTKKTISAKASSPKEITATVASDFRRFAVSGDTTATMGKLATITVSFKDMVGRTKPIMDVDSTKIVVGDVLQAVQVDVMGNNDVASYNFGEFYVDATCSTRTGKMMRTTPTGTAATAKVGSTTGLKGSITTSGTFMFCANVTANTGDQKTETYKRIEPVMYTMGLKIMLQGVDAPQSMQTNLEAGSIKRDGTEVRIGFLTTATDFGADRTVWEGWEGGSYNQRLIITNHGSVPATYVLSGFAMEDGVTVEPTDMAEGVIAAGKKVVMKVRDLVTITGDHKRTSAVLTMAATENNVSVMTTQVTLPEGQTDTVRYHPR